MYGLIDLGIPRWSLLACKVVAKKEKSSMLSMLLKAKRCLVDVNLERSTYAQRLQDA